jgi:hypothetical protein
MPVAAVMKTLDVYKSSSPQPIILLFNIIPPIWQERPPPIKILLIISIIIYTYSISPFYVFFLLIIFISNDSKFTCYVLYVQAY